MLADDDAVTTYKIFIFGPPHAAEEQYDVGICKVSTIAFFLEN